MSVKRKRREKEGKKKGKRREKREEIKFKYIKSNARYTIQSS
jgi:hypothetical protein